MPKVKVTVQVDVKDLAFLAHMAMRGGRLATKTALVKECVEKRVEELSMVGPVWKFEEEEVCIAYLKQAGLL